ncbi:flotillin-like FloA family protein [Aureliella helgolandensis]|uniref:SigmaW regulon antibacterial n=1 Tax=Aureliella helgolandensis TaxID=2527968 RepID=A0A518GAZ0_9BACT|nr:flotillin-like FloA family protein [Aureliella helgolandensis]QDV25775.1 SigmaW regulon antibacterial [Aureliella helgolandensis]
MNPIILLFIAVAALMLVVLIAFFMFFFRPWLQCFLSGAPIRAFDVVGMRLRRSPAQLICEQRIRASYVDTQLTVAELEKAHLQGVDIVRAVDALCLAKQTGVDVRWEDLVATDLAVR